MTDFPTTANNDFGTTNFAFGKFGTSTSCVVSQTVNRVNGASLKTNPDAPLYVFCQQSNGTFKEVSQQLFGQQLYINGGYPVVADFNGDGMDDIFVTEGWDGVGPTVTAYALISQPNGTYKKNTINVSNPYNFSLTTQSAVLDLNNDGCLDIVNSMQAYFLGDCKGNFTAGTMNNNSSDQSVYGTGICTGDFNNTGHNQLVIVDGKTSTWPMQPNAIFETSGTNLTTAHLLPIPYYNTLYNQAGAAHNFSCLVADINKDGKPDIVIFTRPMSSVTGGTWTDQSYVQIYINQGNWNFTDISSTALPGYNTNTAGSYSARLIDVDGDGWVDLVLEGQSGSVAASGNQIWLNNKNNTFTQVFGTELTTLYANYQTQFGNTSNPMTMSMLPISNNDGTWDYIIQMTDSSYHYHMGFANTQYTFK
jgi:hypothetical protein